MTRTGSVQCTMSHVLPDPTSDVQAVQAQQMFHSDEQTTYNRRVSHSTEQGHQSLRKRPRKVEEKIQAVKMKHVLVPTCGEKCRKKMFNECNT